MFKIDLFFYLFLVEIDLVFDQFLNNTVSPKALPVVKRGMNKSKQTILTRMNFVFSVFPAPDSPDMTRLWLTLSV